MFLRSVLVMLFVFIIGASGISSYLERQERLDAAEQRIAIANEKSRKSYADLVDQIEQLKAKPKKRPQEYKTILHLEKVRRKMEKRFPKDDESSSWFGSIKKVNLTTVEVGCMLFIMLLCFLGYSIKEQQQKKNHPLPPGLQQGRYRSSLNDDVANKTHWQPMRGGGANFQTHLLLKQGPARFLLKSSDQLKFFFAAFIFTGLNSMLFGLLRHVQAQGLESAFLNPLGSLASLWNVGAVFVVVGTFLYIRFSPDNTSFDKLSGFLTRGNKQYPLRQLHAIQIVEEIVGGGKSGGVYKSYELNLVQKSGDRIHLMDHGHYQALSSDAEQLAEFIGIPIWENG